MFLVTNACRKETKQVASSKTQFNHIAVEPDDSDEFVVEAGIPAGSNATTLDGTSFTPGPSAEEGDGAVGAPTRGQFHSVASHQQAEANQQQSSSSQFKNEASEYHEQTLEDLEMGPMSKTQKYVIAFLIIFVIGFIAYCFLFFGK